MRTIIDQGCCSILLVGLMVYGGISCSSTVTSLWVRVGVIFVMMLWVLSVSFSVVVVYCDDFYCYYVFV